MQRSNRWLVVILLIMVALQLAACSQSSTDPAEAESDISPAQIEHLDGVNPTRVTLTADAARRLDIQTGVVHEEQVKGQERTVIPYAAVLYDPEGNTWTYTSDAPLTYLREPINIDRIEGDIAVLTDGPALGTTVVTIGAEELFGAEEEFEEE